MQIPLWLILLIVWAALPVFVFFRSKRRREKDLPSEAEIRFAIQRFDKHDHERIRRTLAENQFNISYEAAVVVFGLVSLLQGRNPVRMDVTEPIHYIVDSIGMVDADIMIGDMVGMPNFDADAKSPFPYDSVLHFLHALSVP